MNFPKVTSKQDLDALVKSISDNTIITKDENNYLHINGEKTNILEF